MRLPHQITASLSPTCRLIALSAHTHRLAPAHNKEDVGGGVRMHFGRGKGWQG